MKMMASRKSSGVAVKTEEIETDDEKGEDDRKPEAHVPSTSSGGDAFKEETNNEEDEETTLVEFKFCSISTMTNNYELEGTLHIPMLQDATTGIYSLPMGKTCGSGLQQVLGLEKRRYYFLFRTVFAT